MAFKDTPAPHGATKNPSRDEAEGRNRTYVFQAYPAMRYHADGRECKVDNEGQDAALGDGWSKKPHPPAAVKAVNAAAKEPTMAEIREATAKLLDRHRSQQETIADLTAKVEDLEKLAAGQHAAIEKLQAENAALTKELLDRADLDPAPEAETETAAPPKSKSTRSAK